jgi:hypothetical protein
MVPTQGEGRETAILTVYMRMHTEEQEDCSNSAPALCISHHLSYYSFWLNEGYIAIQILVSPLVA